MRAFRWAVVLLAFLLAGCASQLGYLITQGSQLVRTSSGARGIDSLLASPATDSDTRDFLLRVKAIKSFAVDRLGLKENGNYTRYKEIDKDYLVDVVSACEAASFEGYLWRYPVLGKLPYKGFYAVKDAEEEAARLKAQGYDTIVRKVDAFSTLGFLRDPLYSFMKKYSESEIANLLIHEQTHATLFIKGQPQFNEELATLVGDEGALAWLAEAYGKDSHQYGEAVEARADSERFIELLGELAGELDQVYAQPASREEKLARKSEIVAAFNKRLDSEEKPRFRTEPYRAMGPVPANNAFLSLYRLYTDDIPLLREYWQEICKGDLRAFIEAAGKLARKGDVKELMREALDQG